MHLIFAVLTLQGNIATTGRGGAIAVVSAPFLKLELKSSVLATNMATQGGAVFGSQDCSLAMEATAFLDNAVTANGGAVCV